MANLKLDSFLTFWWSNPSHLYPHPSVSHGFANLAVQKIHLLLRQANHTLERGYDTGPLFNYLQPIPRSTSIRRTTFSSPKHTQTFIQYCIPRPGNTNAGSILLIRGWNPQKSHCRTKRDGLQLERTRDVAYVRIVQKTLQCKYGQKVSRVPLRHRNQESSTKLQRIDQELSCQRHA